MDEGKTAGNIKKSGVPGGPGDLTAAEGSKGAGALRPGFTTGSCAAAAAKAAATLLLLGKRSEEAVIETPGGVLYTAKILDLRGSEQEASCAVEKDGGDDPDVTTGARIYAGVGFIGSEGPGRAKGAVAGVNEIAGEGGEVGTGGNSGVPEVLIDGGEGVGRITRPGLDMPVGSAAINSMPRRMIRNAVEEVCALADFNGSLNVTIWVPGGEELAKRTFNPRLGIEGGISILGTTGIVMPMSEKALKDTIYVELRQRRALGDKSVVIAPGNYGRDFLSREYSFDIEGAVKCSNFIGETLDMALGLGFERVLLVGHIGKLIKVAGGIMNTHSREADCRMELLAAAALREGIEDGTVLRILDCLTTEEALGLLSGSEKLPKIMDNLMSRILFYLGRRTQEKISLECIMFSNEYGTLAKSEGAEWFISQERGRERQI